jgi:replicative superfamily II helicase
MVDFSKRLGKKKVEKPIDPIAIYAGLDRSSEKGELRKAQEHILREWFTKNRDKKDVIFKLHTGQGKTLIGLLALQSKLNEGKGPALYLCPNNQLVEQTCEQAKQFGVPVCRGDDGLPSDFTEGRAILVTNTKKLFNGLTQFKLGLKAQVVGAILMDDSHACVDSIRDAVTIRIERDNPLYAQLIELFEVELKHQGVGTFADIKNNAQDALLPISYWAWRDKAAELTQIFSKVSDSKALLFVWPILRDRLADCSCIVASHAIEITPHLPPLDVFRSYWQAPHRIFMSATVTDDSFLIKGLRLSKGTILNPLTYPDEKWSGEKMIVIPALISDELNRTEIVNYFAKMVARRPYGVVALTPSFAGTADWEKYGANVARHNTIDDYLNQLRAGLRDKTLVLANRYDGVDLADDQCRILIFDSMPYSEVLLDRYYESCRPDSSLGQIRLARSIEQGLGRSVRGEKDYSVIIITGAELVKFMRHSRSLAYLSDQTQKQIEIGLDASESAHEEMKSGRPAMTAMQSLIDQCIKRDAGWKQYYVEKMNELVAGPPKVKGLEIFEKELEAESRYQSSDPDGAVAILQGIADDPKTSDFDKGFYTQEMARYRYSNSKATSNTLQVAAHRKNPYLLKPREGVYIQKLEPLNGARVANVIDWIRSHSNYDQLKVVIEDILSRLQFGVSAEDFERAVQELGKALGFASSRPDKEMKEGPDNLWCLEAGDYLIIEAKSRVLLDRAEIAKDETGQMNNACAWFTTAYPGAQRSRLLIIPTNKLGRAAGFNEEVGIVRKKELGKLVNNTRSFFSEFRTLDFGGLTEAKVNELLAIHALGIDNIKADYQKAVYAGTLT